MNIDVTTLLVAEALVVTTCGVAFIFATVLGRASDVGRTWSAAFTAGILAVICFAVLEFNPQAWFIAGIGNGAFVFAIGAMWNGCRVYNGRSGWTVITAGASIVAAGAVLWEGPYGGVWAGAFWLFLMTAALAASAAVETVRGELRGNVHASALTIVFFIVALYYLVRGTLVITLGVRSPVFTDYFGTVPTSVLAMILVTVAVISMSSLRGVRSPGADAGEAIGMPSGVPGVVPAGQFDQHLLDWLRRGRISRTPLDLVMMEVKGLHHLNSAFGHEFGDAAIRSVGRVACENVPVSSLVGQISSRRYVVLSVSPSDGAARAIIERLETALVENPVDTATGIRAIASFGAVSTTEVGYRASDLLAAAEVALDDERESADPVRSPDRRTS